VESIILAVNLMLPVLLMVALGFFLGKIGLINSKMVEDVNKLCFNLLFPIVIFYSVARADFSQVFNPQLIAFSLGGFLLIFIIATLIIPHIVVKPEQQSVIIQSLSRSNCIVLGTAIMSSLYGAENIATFSMVVAFVSPLFNFLAVITFESINKKEDYSLGRLVLNIIKNPLVIGGVAGITFSLLQIPLPVAAGKVLGDLNTMTITLAMLMMGSDFNINPSEGSYKMLFSTSLSKVILLPAVLLPLGIWCGFRGQPLACLIMIFAAPTPVSNFVMAQNYGADQHLASQVIVLTSLIAIATYCVIIALFNNLALI